MTTIGKYTITHQQAGDNMKFSISFGEGVISFAVGILHDRLIRNLLQYGEYGNDIVNATRPKLTFDINGLTIEAGYYGGPLYSLSINRLDGERIITHIANILRESYSLLRGIIDL